MHSKVKWNLQTNRTIWPILSNWMLFYQPQKTPKHRREVSRSFFRSNFRNFFSPASPLRGWSVLRWCLNRKELRPKPTEGLQKRAMDGNMRTVVLLHARLQGNSWAYCFAITILPQKSCNIFMDDSTCLMELQLRFWSPKPNVLTNHLPHFPSPNQQTLAHWHQRGIQTISEKSWNQFSNFWIRLIKFFSHLTQMVFPFDDFFKKSQKWPAISFAHRCACMEVTSTAAVWMFFAMVSFIKIKVETPKKRMTN